MNITNSLEKSFLSSYTQSLIKSHWPYISQIIPCTTKPWRYLSISFPLYSFYFIFTYNLTSTFSLNKCNTCYSSFPFADFFYLPSFFLSVIHSDLCYSVSLPLLLPALALSLSSVQSVSHVWLFGTPWTAAQQASLSITNSRSSLKLISIESVMPSDHLIVPFSCLQFFPASGSFQRSQFFASGGQSMSFSFSINPATEYSGLISFRMDW